MTVRAVGQNENSSLFTVIKSTAVGTGVGYALKYLWPVVGSERNLVHDRYYLNMHHKAANNLKVNEFMAQPERTPAQDTFIKMAKSKDKRTFAFSNIAEEVKALGGEESVNGKELRAIVKKVNNIATKLCKIDRIGYKLALKYKRPAVPFLVAGGGVGFISGFMNNVVKNDV